MDVKKFFADLFAMYRKPTEPPPPAAVEDADAAPEAGRNAGYEADHAEEDEASRNAEYEDDLAEGYEVGRQTENEANDAEGYEAGHKKDYDEGVQIGLEAKTPPEPELDPIRGTTSRLN
jgi:hypothetical protein